jgi:hypothetical protein
MERVEQLRHERKCRYLSLTTMDWKGLPFYPKDARKLSPLGLKMNRASK